MRKMVVFNVGGALCSYLEIGEKRIIVDLGKSDSFNPVKDFLIPLFEERNVEKNKENKYSVDQLIISHPHIDHISAICDFDDLFSPNLLTCPNDKDENEDENKLDLSEFDSSSPEVKCLKAMYKDRRLPLTTAINDTGTDRQDLFYLKPKTVKDNSDLSSGDECYQNNVSLVVLFNINGHRVLFPGDIMKNGMKKLLEENPAVKTDLGKHHLCILVAPHHGLRSSFSVDLFNVIKDNKTRCLNIISEKENNPDENRCVDSRYASEQYCMGDNDLSSGNGESLCYQRKTSQGHICIDFSNGSRPEIEIIQDIEELIEWFCHE